MSVKEHKPRDLEEAKQIENHDKGREHGWMCNWEYGVVSKYAQAGCAGEVVCSCEFLNRA